MFKLTDIMGSTLQVYNPVWDHLETVNQLKSTLGITSHLEKMKINSSVWDLISDMQKFNSITELQKNLVAMQIGHSSSLFKTVFQSFSPAINLYNSTPTIPLYKHAFGSTTVKMFSPLMELQKSLQKTMQIYNSPWNSISTFEELNPVKELQSSLKSMLIQNSAWSNIDPIGVLSDKRWQLALEDTEELCVDNTGEVSLGDESMTLETLQDMASYIVKDIEAKANQNINNRLDQILAQISALKDPFYQKVLSWLFYPLIVGIMLSVINPITDFYVKKLLTSNEKKAVVKEITVKISMSPQSNSQLTSFRIVSANVLDVYEENTHKSPTIENLRFGDIVEVVDKEKSWSLVKWYDPEDNSMVEGWVFSRYLKKIKS